MKRALAVILGALMLISVSGCEKKPSDVTTPEQGTAPTAEMQTETASATTASFSTSTDKAPEDVTGQSTEATLENPDTVVDISKWSHPIRKVLEGFGFSIVKVELFKNNTYPVITVDSVEIGYNEDTKSQYVALLNDAARANGYWDYAIRNRTMDQFFEVTCNRDGKNVTAIAVNGKNQDAAVPQATATGMDTLSDEQVMAYLMEQVPEIDKFNKQVQAYNASNNTAGKPIMRIDSTPDPNGTTAYEKNFYSVYIGESVDTHTSRWTTFLVRKDLKEVLADDPATGQYITLTQWREQNP